MTDSIIRAMIVDDEPTAREGLRLLLAPDQEIAVVAESGDGRDAVAKIESLRPDLLFLDVQMPEFDGFEVLSQLTAPPPLVIFVTAYDAYALDAFDRHALDYLLKPFSDERFSAAVARARRQLRLQRVAEVSQRLMNLLNDERATPLVTAASTERRPTERLAIKSAGRVRFVDVEDIRWIEAADYYVSIHTDTDSHLHRESLSSLEQRLDPARFVRVHRKAIVRRQCIREMIRTEGRHAVVVLDDKTQVPVSRRFRDRAQSLLSPP